ncbi:FAD binding domain-containing protein [Parasphaerochaeta coccoides]|uniref:Molybdopterin dehydrogenase FAD-binding protein n=1 Tax=Parasphaerochaeta coccoides (strain ATCC BAA-1237 / DSM 17374 / SPN1) TaxID=760011 RepID=F4GLV1_PARC1|nr:FAD binding domain-containing protein [Parasphaerochaeta coccoides]AEC02992.1 molybdopterin dehydrogenase FAD-binding protein [Parasphaerochaeta coccoides DSM 17374]
MYEGIKSPTIHSPRTIGEALSILNRTPDARLWAGGTYIMSRPDAYPGKDASAIIDLAGIPELKKITRNDRFVEIGAMVTASQLTNTGKLLLSDLMLDTLKSTASPLYRRQLTIGGTLCTPDIRLSLPTTLAVLESAAEVRYLQRSRIITRWIPIARLYGKNGALLMPPKSILSKIRISLDMPGFQRFRVIDHPMLAPRDSVLFAFQCQGTQGTLSRARFCFTYPTAGFHQSREMEALLSGQDLPLSPDKVRKFSSQLVMEIARMHPGVTPLQLERSRRLFAEVLHDIDVMAMEK